MAGRAHLGTILGPIARVLSGHATDKLKRLYISYLHPICPFARQSGNAGLRKVQGERARLGTTPDWLLPESLHQRRYPPAGRPLRRKAANHPVLGRVGRPATPDEASSLA